MADSFKRAITAIGDNSLESFIASSLTRLGWTVELRALSFDDLKEELLHSQVNETIIFYAPDLKGYTSFPSWIKAIDVSSQPASDFELSELIERREDKVSRATLKSVSGIPIVGVGSFGRDHGASTIALNLAQECALKGVRTLLIDAHPRNPFVANYFGIYGVNRKVVEISENLSIVELSQLTEFSTLEQSIDSIDLIIIECGDVWQPAQSINGRRDADSGFSWIAHNADELLIVIHEESFNPRMSQNPFELLEKVAMKPIVTYICNKVSPINRSTKERLALKSAGLTIRPVSLLPMDSRALTICARDRSTLAYSVAKSLLRREILALCDSRSWWRN